MSYAYLDKLTRSTDKRNDLTAEIAILEDALVNDVSVNDDQVACALELKKNELEVLNIIIPKHQAEADIQREKNERENEMQQRQRRFQPRY